jgi:hypothetical protein
MLIIVFRGVLKSWAIDWRYIDLNLSTTLYFSNFYKSVTSVIEITPYLLSFASKMEH